MHEEQGSLLASGWTRVASFKATPGLTFITLTSDSDALRRIPAAYRMLLAEAMRRAAWQSLFAQQAGRLDEHMGRMRDKEAGRRAAFLQQVGVTCAGSAVSEGIGWVFFTLGRKRIPPSRLLSASS